ncbi:MAG: sigma-70 family RNA polymerase sigma factor [Halobacteriota archaeon]
MPSIRDSDQFLVRLAQDGDRAAFDVLVLRYRRLLIRQVLPLLRDINDAEDVVQEAFVSAYNAIRNFRGDAAFFTWVYRIAMNSAKRYRQESAQRFPLVSDIVENENAEGIVREGQMSLETPESLLEGHEVLRLINEVFDKLPPEQQEVLMMREIDGLSYEEIAENMHCPVGTVRSRVHRARDAISTALSKVALTLSTGEASRH